MLLQTLLCHQEILLNLLLYKYCSTSTDRKKENPCKIPKSCFSKVKPLMTNLNLSSFFHLIPKTNMEFPEIRVSEQTGPTVQSPPTLEHLNLKVPHPLRQRFCSMDQCRSTAQGLGTTAVEVSIYKINSCHFRSLANLCERSQRCNSGVNETPCTLTVHDVKRLRC